MSISSAVTNKGSLGAAMGLTQTVVAIQRMAGPAVADWLFAFSLMNNVLSGNFAYVIFVIQLASVCAFRHSFHGTCGHIAASRGNQINEVLYHSTIPIVSRSI